MHVTSNNTQKHSMWQLPPVSLSLILSSTFVFHKFRRWNVPKHLVWWRPPSFRCIVYWLPLLPSAEKTMLQHDWPRLYWCALVCVLSYFQAGTQGIKKCFHQKHLKYSWTKPVNNCCGIQVLEFISDWKIWLFSPQTWWHYGADGGSSPGCSLQ